MAKADFNEKLKGIGDLMKTKASNTPLQKSIVVAESTKTASRPTTITEEETRFTVHIPTTLMERIKNIGHKDKKKIKAIFVEALSAYATAKEN